MNTRAYRATDYATLLDWWRGHHWAGQRVAEPLISPHTIMVEGTEDRKRTSALGDLQPPTSDLPPSPTPLACGMIYKVEGCPMGLLGFVVSNPALSARESSEALSELARALMERLETLGVQLAAGYFDQESLNRLFAGEGFQDAGNVRQMVWSKGPAGVAADAGTPQGEEV